MKAEIKILHTLSKITKEGKPYQVIYSVVIIDGTEFIRKFYLF